MQKPRLADVISFALTDDIVSGRVPPGEALDEATIEAARDAIESHRQRQKNISYFKAAMTWAANKKRVRSGLVVGTTRWWEHLDGGDPDPDVLGEPQNQAAGIPLSRFIVQPLPGVQRHGDGGDRRD